MTQNITSAAAAARETARTATGQFGHQAHAEADIDLSSVSEVQIDDAVRSLPPHRPVSAPYDWVPPTGPSPKETLLGAVAEHYAARGGATMRLLSPARHGSPANVEVASKDAEYGTTTAVFGVGEQLHLRSMHTAAGTDLSGHPGYNALSGVDGVVISAYNARAMSELADVELDPATELMLLNEVKDPDKRWQATRAVRTLAASGFGLTPTGFDEEENRVFYDLRDGNRLEIQLSTGAPSYSVTRAPGDHDGLDHFDHTHAWTSALDPRSQREILDDTLSTYVFADHLDRNGASVGLMSYGGADTTTNAYGEVINLTVHESQEQVSLIRSGGNTVVTVLDEEGVDLIHYPNQYAEALQRISTRPDAEPAEITTAIAAAADEVERIRIESPDWSALRD